MSQNLTEEVTQVDRVPAFVVALGGGKGSYGPSEVAVDVAAGSCVLTIGRVFASLDRAAALELTHALHLAVGHLPTGKPDGPALAHARQMVEGLGVEWPA